jgi:hypothetical protein
MNSGLNSLNVYPSLGESLDNLAVNIPYLLLPGQGMKIVAIYRKLGWVY